MIYYIIFKGESISKYIYINNRLEKNIILYYKLIYYGFIIETFSFQHHFYGENIQIIHFISIMFPF